MTLYLYRNDVKIIKYLFMAISLPLGWEFGTISIESLILLTSSDSFMQGMFKNTTVGRGDWLYILTIDNYQT